VPTQSSDGSVTVAAYGDSAEVSSAFATAVGAMFGSGVAVDDKMLAPTQCGVLGFLKDNGGNSPGVSMALRSEEVEDGGFLEGSIRRAPRSIVYLFIVDDDGKVLSADDALVDNGTTLNFRAEVHATGSGLGSNQLLVAVISSEMLAMPEEVVGKTADEFFTKLNQEVASKELFGGASIDIAMTSFFVVD
jgi:hypothetical protein